MSYKLLTLSNTKILKSLEKGYRTAILHLSPASLSGHNVCPMASAGCIATCLNTSGMGKFDRVQQARIRRTKLFFDKRADFMLTLHGDITRFIRDCEREGLKPCLRLNGTSDLSHWTTSIIPSYPSVQFYDYTAVPKYLTSSAGLGNYHLTFSRKEHHKDDYIQGLVRKGTNVAVVFKGSLPATYLGLPVINGDEHDLRFLDPKGVIVGLSAKGRAKKDTTGFVVTTEDT